MSTISSGYENKPLGEKDIPSPSLRSWVVDIDRVGASDEGKVIYAVIKLDNAVIGMVRLPDDKHLIEFRRRVEAWPLEQTSGPL